MRVEIVSPKEVQKYSRNVQVRKSAYTEIVPDPKLIDPKELGVTPQGDQLPKDPNKPSVLRSARGQIIWRLLGNTPEQNEDLGIRNFQGLFLNCFPEFDSLFPRKPNGKVQEDIKGAVSQFISKAVMDERFRQLTVSATSRISTPYFEGSYAKAVQKSFSSWGIEVVLRTVGQRSRVVLVETGVTTERQVTFSALKRRYSLDFKTLANYLQGLDTREVKGLNGHTVVSYNEAEAQTALATLTNRPRVDPEKGKYIDQQGKAWVTLRDLTKQVGVANDGNIKKLLLGIPTIEGRAITGVRTILYDEASALQALADIIALPKVDKTGRYVDQTGRAWIAISALATSFRISETSLRRFLSEMPALQQLEARAKGRRCTLCAEIETKVFLSQKVGVAQSEKASVGGEFALLPKVSKETGLYTDSQNESWAPAAVFLGKFGVGKNTITEERLKGVRFIDGRGATNQPTKLYNTQQLLQAFSSFIDVPVVDKETTEYTDKEGNVWVSQKYLCDLYGIGSPTLKPFLATITLLVRGVNGRLIIVYPKIEMNRRLEACQVPNSLNKYSLSKRNLLGAVLSTV